MVFQETFLSGQEKKHVSWIYSSSWNNNNNRNWKSTWNNVFQGITIRRWRTAKPEKQEAKWALCLSQFSAWKVSRSLFREEELRHSRTSKCIKSTLRGHPGETDICVMIVGDFNTITNLPCIMLLFSLT